MARSRIVFGQSDERTLSLEVDGDPEKVVGTLKNGWAQLNQGFEGDEESNWVWVNAQSVAYVEAETSSGGGTFV